MKIQVQHVVNVAGKAQLGRTSWIGKTSEGELIFSNIYVNEDTAYSDLDVYDLAELEMHMSVLGTFKIINIIPNVA